MTDIENLDAKAIYPHSRKQLTPDRNSEEGRGFEKNPFMKENSGSCSREVVIKLIDKIKQL